MGLPQLDRFLRRFAHLFRRGTTWRKLERYVTGLLTDLRRKNCDTIADAVAGTSSQQLQHLLTDAKWDSAALDQERVSQLAEISPPDGVLLVDDTGLGKKGTSSVGVHRQYSGTLGAIGNCQVVVSTEYLADELTSTQPLHWPVNARLYLPEAWMEDDERRRKAHVPKDMTLKRKWEIAIDLIDQAREWHVPYRHVVADAAYGDSHDFLTALEERQISYVCGVERQFGVRLPHEVQEAKTAPLPEYKGVGRRRTVQRLAPLHQVGAVVQRIPEEAWRTITWRQGTKGPLRKQFAAVRVHHARGNPEFGRSIGSWRASTGPEGWLLAERPLPGDEGDAKWYISNLPADTPLERLVALAHARWPMEQFYEDGKGECGLDDYQGRSWHGLHRHLALVMLTYSFLAHERMAAPQDGGDAFSPLCASPELPGRAPASAALAAVRSHLMDHRHEPTRSHAPS